MARDYRFSFGPWNIHEGSDPFGPTVRPSIAFATKLKEYKKLGFEGVQLHDDDAVPDVDSKSAQQVEKDAKQLAGMLKDTVSPQVIERMRASFAAHDPNVAERAAKGYAILERSLARLDAAGARIILGCDTGLPDHFFGYAEQKELELMAAAGMSPMRVIVAATSRAAEYLGVTETGTLMQGKRADFLVLDANPLDDIRNTRRIAAIYIGGAMVDRAALRRSLQKAN